MSGSKYEQWRKHMERYCPKCNCKYDVSRKFCEKCGAQLQEVIEIKLEDSKMHNNHTMESRKETNKLLISIFVVLVIFIVGGTVFALYYFSPKEKMLRMLDAGEYEAAVQIYEQELDGNTEAKEKLIGSLEERVLQIQDDFMDKNIDYDTARSILTTIAEMNIDISSYREVSTYIDNLQQSREAYQKAENFRVMEDYVEAIHQYGLVNEVDENYSDAISKISICEQSYKINILAKAEAFVAEGNYYDAVQLLINASRVLVDDNDIETLIIMYKKDEIIAEMKKYEQGGDYAGAIAYGRTHQDEINSDPELLSFLDSYINLYRNEILLQAEYAFENEGYISAINVYSCK